MTTQNVRHGAGTLEILLHQTQLLARTVVVIWVEHLGQFFCIDTLLLGTQEITVVEFGQIERVRMGRLPQSQRLCYAVTITQYR